MSARAASLAFLCVSVALPGSALGESAVDPLQTTTAKPAKVTTATSTTAKVTTATSTTATSTMTTTTTSLTTAVPQRLGSFLVLGDWGWNPAYHGEITSRACQSAVAKSMHDTAALLGDVKFVVNVGDSFYHDGVRNKSDPLWDSAWRDVYSKELRSVPWYSVYGNHDYHWDPCACTDNISECAQLNADPNDLNYFYMPNVSYYVERDDLNLEVVALDMNYYTWVNHTCPQTECEDKCRKNLQHRMDDAFELFYSRAAKSRAENLVVFSHYPTDYFWGFPDFLDELRNNETHRIHYFGGHRHNVDQFSTTSIWPNDSWLSGGGGGWGCEWYSKEQGFVVGEIGADGAISTYPVVIDFDVCCSRPKDR